MEQIYKSLKELATPERVTKISTRLNIHEADLSLAVSTIFAGFLQLTQASGDTMQLRKLFDEAGSLDILSRIESTCVEKLTPETISIGDHFLEHVLGNSTYEFTNRISVITGLSNVVTNTLIAILAPVYVAYVGDKMISNRWSMKKLLGMLNAQKETYRNFVPIQVV